MKKQIFAMITVCVFLLTACGAGLSAQPTATLAPPTATLPPTLTQTPEPTFTPTATATPRLPVAPGTQLPAPGLAISADNLDQVVELARWGKGVITDTVYSPDGKLIAVATTLGVSIYQADTLEEKIYFETGARVNNLAYSSDGETIATGLNDNTVKLWKASDGTLLKSFDGHTDEKAKKDAKKAEVTSVAISPDGSQIAGGSTDGTVSLWQVSDGSLLNTIMNHTEEVTSVFFSLDGQALFSASWDGKVNMIQILDGKQLRRFSGGGSDKTVIDATISVDGKLLAAYSSQSGNLILWNVEDGTKITSFYARLEPGYIEVTSIAFSPDGQYIAAAYENHTAKIWSVKNGDLQNTFKDLVPKEGSYYRVNFAIAISPENQNLILAGSNIFGIWDFKTGAFLRSKLIKTDKINDIALSSDGHLLASVEGPSINLWQFPYGSLIPYPELMQCNGNVDFSPDGTTLLTSLFDKTVRLFPISGDSVKKSFETDKTDLIGAVAYSPDGQTVALETRFTGMVELRNVSDGSLVRTMKIGTASGVGSVIFSADGKYLAAALDDQVRLFQVSDGKSLNFFKGGSGIAFSPDATMFASGGVNKTVTIWKVPSGGVLFTFRDRPDTIYALTFSPDGRLLISGSVDGTIEVFLVSEGTLLKSWKGHSDGVSDLIFTSDGKLLISSSWDGTIRMWGIKP